MKHNIFFSFIVLIVVLLLFSCSKTTEPDLQVSRPVFYPPGGIYTTGQIVSISCDTEDAIIRYTTDGTEPTDSSQVYSDPIEVSSTTTLRAKAFKPGWLESQVGTAVYSITGTVAPLSFDPPGGSYSSLQTVSIHSETEEAVIRYTINGSDPDESSPLYTAPIEIVTTSTLRAKGFKQDWEPSEIATAEYSIELITPGEMVYVQGGPFVPYEVAYNVTLSSYYVGKYEVTQGEYLSVMGNNPSDFTGDLERPIENVSWFDSIEYCNRLSMEKGLTPAYSYNDGTDYGTNPDDWPSGWNEVNANHNNVNCNWSVNGFRLLTEMEWEYAARGGVAAHNAGTFQDRWAGTDDENELINYAIYNVNSEGKTHPIGRLLPNELGIHDMSGNVYNWVWDIYELYPSGSFTDPTGPESGHNRVIRGGSWNADSDNCEAINRIINSSGPVFKNHAFGFRVARRGL